MTLAQRRVFGVLGRCSEGVCAAESFFFLSFFSIFYQCSVPITADRKGNGRQNGSFSGDVVVGGVAPTGSDCLV